MAAHQAQGASMTTSPRPQVGDVVAWRRTPGGHAFGVVQVVDHAGAEVRVIHGSPSKTARRPLSAFVVVLSASRFVDGLERALHDALQALDGAGPGADGGGRR